MCTGDERSDDVTGEYCFLAIGCPATRIYCCDPYHYCVMDMAIFRTIFFELLVFFTFTLLTFHFAY